MHEVLYEAKKCVKMRLPRCYSVVVSHKSSNTLIYIFLLAFTFCFEDPSEVTLKGFATVTKSYLVTT